MWKYEDTRNFGFYPLPGIRCTVCHVLSFTFCTVLSLYLIQSVLSDILDMAGKVEVDINLLTILKDFEICAR